MIQNKSKYVEIVNFEDSFIAKFLHTGKYATHTICFGNAPITKSVAGLLLPSKVLGFLVFAPILVQFIVFELKSIQ